MWSNLWRDVRYATRTLRRNPGFAAVAMITLALGIGANTAIFNILNGVVLTPLQFGSPEELVVVWESNPAEEPRSATAHGTYLDWRDQSTAFAGLGAWTYDSFVVEGDGDATAVTGVLTSTNFLDVLRIDPLFGRGFRDDDVTPGQRGSAVLVSHRLWRDRWGADPGIVGRTIRVDNRAVTVVGVMPPSIDAPDTDADLWMPVGLVEGPWYTRYGRRWAVYGRLAAGTTMAQAEADLNRIHEGLKTGQLYEVYHGWRVELQPLQAYVVGNAQRTLAVAFAAVGLVLLIACINIANMLLARAAGRQREIAIRRALGAGRSRLGRQFITEGLLLSLGGGALGLVFALGTHRAILAAQPGILPRVEELGLDWTALGFALAASVLTGLLFGAAPALHAARVNVLPSLSQGGTRGTTVGGSQRRLRGGLVVAQLALTVVLLSGAGLLVRSLIELGRVDPGFQPDRVAAARVFLDQNRFADDGAARQYVRDLTATLERLPGVEHAGATTALPMDPLGVGYGLPYRLVGQEGLENHELPEADFRVVTPGYFESLGVPLRRGRPFTTADTEDQPAVMVVNEAMADLVWPGRSPVGERLQTPSVDWVWHEVVGVVGDIRSYSLGTAPRPEIYVVHAQAPQEELAFVIRTAGSTEAAAEVLRRTILRHNPAQPAHSVVTMPALIAGSLATDRFYLLVLGLFAGVALVLSAAGVYGVLAYWVNLRTPEIGVRMALGADRRTVLMYVVRHGMSLAGIGVIIGVGIALIATRVLRSTLYGIGPADPITFATVIAVLGGTALLACWVPARRASRVDPATVLGE